MSLLVLWHYLPIFLFWICLIITTHTTIMISWKINLPCNSFKWILKHKISFNLRVLPHIVMNGAWSLVTVISINNIRIFIIMLNSWLLLIWWCLPSLLNFPCISRIFETSWLHCLNRCPLHSSIWRFTCYFRNLLRLRLLLFLFSETNL